MIRGVNKNVIEISDTGNEHFERAILFVRPDQAKKDDDHIRRSALDYLSGMKLRSRFYPRHTVLLKVIGWIGAAALGAAVTALFLLI